MKRILEVFRKKTMTLQLLSLTFQQVLNILKWTYCCRKKSWFLFIEWLEKNVQRFEKKGSLVHVPCISNESMVEETETVERLETRPEKEKSSVWKNPERCKRRSERGSGVQGVYRREKLAEELFGWQRGWASEIKMAAPTTSPQRDDRRPPLLAREHQSFSRATFESRLSVPCSGFPLFSAPTLSQPLSSRHRRHRPRRRRSRGNKRKKQEREN